MMIRRMKSALMYAVLVAGAAVILTRVTACNTVEGVGKDTEAVGHEIHEEAAEHK